MAVDDDEELTIDDLDDDSDLGEDSSGGDDPSWGATMVVNNVTYAVSLFWQPLQDVDDPLPEVKETANSVMDGADVYCLRTGASPQYGVGNTQEGHQPGQPSAAAAVADLFADKSSSVAVFEVEEGWWFVAVRNDLILSEEDILYLEEEDAKRAFFAMMAVPDWGRKIAPASWGIEGTEEVNLEDILTSPGSSKMLRIGGGKDSKTLMIAAGAGVLLLLIIYKLVSGLFSSSAPKQIKPIVSLPAFVDEAPVQQVVEIKPWEKLPVVDEMVMRCFAGVQQARSMVVPGWDLVNVSCDASGVTANWIMQWGHVGWVKRAFEEYSMEGMDYFVSDDAKSAFATISIGELPTSTSTPKYSIYEIREELNNIFQAMKSDISMEDDRGAPPVLKTTAGGLGTEVVQGARAYPKLKFSFSSEYQPADWLSLFHKFPGLEIINLTYTPGNNIWQYEGQIYEAIR